MRPAIGPKPEYPHGFRTVLHLAQAQVVEGRFELTRHLFVHAAGDANPARFRHGLEPDGDDHPVAIEIAALDNHVAEIYSNAKDDTVVFGHALICRRELLLQFDRTGNCIDGAGELDQHPIAHHLDDAPVMARHSGIENRSSAVPSAPPAFPPHPAR